MLSYGVIGAAVCFNYGAIEPVKRVIRLKNLRLEQIRLAIEVRATLIREAKERKEQRKQKKIEAFNNFTIDLGEGDEEDDNDTVDDLDTDRNESEKKKKFRPIKSRHLKTKMNTIMEEANEESQIGTENGYVYDGTFD